MARSKKTESTVELAPVEDADERPYAEAVRSPEDTAAVEARFHLDQIEDYHAENPTLDTSGPEHDPEVQREVRMQALEPLMKAAKDAADQPRYSGNEDE